MKSMLPVFRTAGIAIILAAVLCLSRANPPQTQAEPGTVIVRPAAAFDVSPPLAALVKASDGCSWPAGHCHFRECLVAGP